ncbi:MAG: hypothetical protein O3B70_02350 [Bacteroidetes bacterium]|nr:hypothetical protein [Bacteroidota bacterium]MDA0903152.1 hypothetical protein [Bacteroidota bacterium]MDA1242399.1 hypothetical protein [Bacteroidota bacterium]
MNSFSFKVLTGAICSCALVMVPLTLEAQTPSAVEAAEYEPNSDRWLVSNGNSILVTDDLGATWSVFGTGGATHGMEVLGSTLFAIQNNVIRAYDVVSGELLGSLSPNGATFLNGMGSESNVDGDILVVSDFSAGRLLKVDVSDPANMTYSTLVANTGTTPNGVTLVNGQAYVVNWGGNSDILKVDVQTGAVETVVNGSGLGNCDGIDYVDGTFVVSSWTPQRITLFTPDPVDGSWVGSALVQGSPLSNPADLSINTTGDTYAVACSGNNTVYFGTLMDLSPVVDSPSSPDIQIQWNDSGVMTQQDMPGTWTVRGFDLSGRLLGSKSWFEPPGSSVATWEQLGAWSRHSNFLEFSLEGIDGRGVWRQTLKTAH